NMSKLAIGVDLGATKIESALVTREGEVLLTDRRPTNPELGPESVLAALAASIDILLMQAPHPVAGVGIGSPGQVNPYTGVVYQASNLGWSNVNIPQRLNLYLTQSLPLFVQRDSYAELLGEYYFGAGKGHDHIVYMGLGSGLGGAAMVDGRLIEGHTFTASEIGHLVIDPSGRLCGCGLHGCAETVVSGNGAAAQARAYLATNRFPSTLADNDTLNGTAVLQAAAQGDPLALAVMNDVADWFTRLTAAYTIILNPECIIIGGGFGKAAFDLIVPYVQEHLQKRVLNGSWQPLQFKRSQIASSAIGASTLVWQNEKKLPQTLSDSLTNSVQPVAAPPYR
ncbi:MAG: ROK family protein, partial [Anaerolineales bacterium]|nr:ROK family protein [Anaerolineales bacterium]